jgi:2'-5' RNA ligase
MRLFIALDTEPDIRNVLSPVHSFLAGHSNIVKIVPSEDFHVTVKFFGECRTGIYEDIKKSFANIFKPSYEMKYTLKGLGAFPDLHHAQVIWCGIYPESDEVQRAFASVESFAEQLGFPREKRKFIPHVTLARVRKGMKLTSAVVQFIREREQTVFVTSRFTRLALYSSTLTPKGPLYRVEQEIIL